MTIKRRLCIYISLLFTVLYGVISVVIIVSFALFRKGEFEDLLKDKAQTTIKLLNEFQVIDQDILKKIDRTTINQLYNEKTLVFDSKYNLIYSSLDDTRIDWKLSDLQYLDHHESFFRRVGEYEIYGVHTKIRGNSLYAMVSANDNYGNRKLQFLIYLLICAYLLSTLLTWILTYYVVKAELLPLDFFIRKISKINESNLETRLQIDPKSDNEIDLIGKEFNFMLGRIENAYQRQKEFTAHASHELRTPLTRISVQIENHLKTNKGKGYEFLSQIAEDVNQLALLVRSLLLLSKMDTRKRDIDERARLDEALFNSIEEIHHTYKNLKVSLSITEDESLDQLLEVRANQNLLEIVFMNLLKNAWLYSDNQQVQISIHKKGESLEMEFINSGEPLLPEEQKNIFEPFMRGENAKAQSGLGLGLRIVHRILNFYNFSIRYSATENQNRFTLRF